MTTLKELFIKYEYPTDIKFKSNEKFLVSLEHLEITSWGPMGDGVRPKHHACLCEECKKSDIKYSHNWLGFEPYDEYNYPDILNLQVDVDAFYVDALPANFKTSPKLSEKEIADMFYKRIMEANGYELCTCAYCQNEIEQIKIKDETTSKYYNCQNTSHDELGILSKVLGEFLPWDIDNVDEIADKLFLEEQEFITTFYDTLNNYIMEEKEHYNEVLQIFKKIKKDVGKILYKYLRPHAYRSVTTGELQIMLDNWRFTFTDFEDGLLIKTIDEKYYTYVGSKFKLLLYLFDKGTKVSVQKEENLFIQIIYLGFVEETYELTATPYDQLEEGSVTDEDGIEINEPSLSDKEKLLKLLGDLYWLTDKVKLWDENNLAEGFENLSDKHKKEIIKYVLHYPNYPDETGFYISEDEMNCLLRKLDKNWESWDKSKKKPSSHFGFEAELKELELENDYQNYYKFLQYLSLLNETKPQQFDKPRYVTIACYYTKNENKYYNKTYLLTIENYIDFVLKYFTKYLPHVEMRPEYTYNLFTNEMSEYKKDLYFESIYEHILEFLKRYSTLIEEEIK